MISLETLLSLETMVGYRDHIFYFILELSGLQRAMIFCFFF